MLLALKISCPISGRKWKYFNIWINLLPANLPKTCEQMENTFYDREDELLNKIVFPDLIWLGVEVKNAKLTESGS